MTTTREALAAYAHEAWSRWVRHTFEKSERTDDGSFLIPPWAVKRWMRQMETPYEHLPEDEKESDLLEADKMIAIMEARGMIYTDTGYITRISERHWLVRRAWKREGDERSDNDLALSSLPMNAKIHVQCARPYALQAKLVTIVPRLGAIVEVVDKTS